LGKKEMLARIKACVEKKRDTFREAQGSGMERLHFCCNYMARKGGSPEPTNVVCVDLATKPGKKHKKSGLGTTTTTPAYFASAATFHLTPKFDDEPHETKWQSRMEQTNIWIIYIFI